MKIGILTFHRAHNYGAVLQCYALQEILKNMGHDVWVIDYRQQHIENLYKIRLKKILKNLVRPTHFINYLKGKIVYKKFQKEIQLTKRCNEDNIPNFFDVYFIGSDQVWSLDCTGGYDKVFSGDFNNLKEKKIIGYAISVNQQSLNLYKDDKLKRMIDNFTQLSFREKNNADYIQKISKKEVYNCLDPTLLTNREDWNNQINKEFDRKKFALIYEVRKHKTNPNIIKNKALEYAQRENLELIDLTEKPYSVKDFLTAFAKTECVFTSSFHACVFSIIFKKKLFAFKLNDGNDNRYINLLNSIKADSFIYDLNDNIYEDRHYDYIAIHKELDALKQDSLNFIKNCLS